MAEQILKGIRVIDAASFIAAPASATIMADFGADVIKIEPVGRGDPYRTSLSGPGYPDSKIASWFVDNRNKRGVALDLKSDSGQEVLRRLCETADVFITNMPLGPRERLAIRYEDIAAINPKIIYAVVSAYGENGPEAQRTGFDSTAYWARSGLMDLVKPAPDSAPARSMPGMGDHPTATALFGAIMLALYRRAATGEGGMVSTSLLANGLWSNAISVQNTLCGSVVMHRPPRDKADNALNNFYVSRDGRWFHLIMITGEGRFADLAAALGAPELAEDPRFSSPEKRQEHVKELIPVFDALFAARDGADIRRILTEGGFTFGETHPVGDALTDQQMQEGGGFRRVAENLKETDGLQKVEYVVDSPIEVSGAVKTTPVAPPQHGEHTNDILREAGYSDADIEALREKAIIS